jgi:hypothetical protein
MLYIITLDERNTSQIDGTGSATDTCYFCNMPLPVGQRKRIVMQNNFKLLGIPDDKISTVKTVGYQRPSEHRENNALCLVAKQPNDL